ncbi:hypothetical protein DFH07DRAFT_469868 [Mycena maculata]|uniref:Uncharacterized protein n=1 Tax=Mycena maculata TaxID=230809 RepID=A0AAD7K880_9AGAR|nr:hypothetical protein DFH07DRAFT_469868 [Mycena maculata]
MVVWVTLLTPRPRVPSPNSTPPPPPLTPASGGHCSLVVLSLSFSDYIALPQHFLPIMDNLDNPIVQKLIDFLSTELKPLVAGDRHAGYANTREPIEYDYHMPGWLQLKKIEHNPQILLDLENNLVTKLVERASVKDKSMDVDAIRKTYRVAGLVPVEAVGESSVLVALVNIHRIASSIATLCCFDVDEEDGDFLPVFGAGGSPGTNTIADLMVGCQPRDEDQPERWGSLWPSITEPRDLRDPYFRDLYTEEFKSIRTANPGAILGIYVLIFCLQNKYLKRFWPKNECEGCPKFRKSHQAVDDEETPQGPPPDAPDTDIPTTELEVLQEEMGRLADLAQAYHEAHEQTKKRQRAADDERVTDLKSYEQLLREATVKAAKVLRFTEEIESQLPRWVLNAAYMLIQVWSHMVRFNGTVARLTCHNLGVIMTRHRESGTMAISNFVQHTDKPILVATALTIYAYTDAVERHDLHIANDEPFWLEDPYRGETLAEIKKELEEDEDEDEEEDGDDEDEEDEDAHPPVNTRGGGRGGRGGGGGGPGRGGRGGGGSSRGGRGGGDQGGSGGKPSGRGGNNTTSKTEQQRQDRQKRMDSRNKKDNIDADSTHEAFVVRRVQSF